MSATRLPGVYFQTVVQPVPEVLPRMDIPAFVGFAASGPFDVPVAVEDTVHFHDIFGKDQPLAWDTQRGELAYAQLAPAVRAFFRNGGRRCWIVRVAHNASAVSNGFLVPGLLETQADGSYAAASLVARSEGSWSDDLMLNATITALPLDTASVIIPQVSPNGSYVVKLQPGVPCPLVSGDMLQLIFSGGQASPPAATDAVLFLPIEEVGIQFLSQNTGSPQTQVGRPPTQQFALSGHKGFWFRPSVEQEFPASAPSSPAPASDIAWMALPTGATWLTQPENVSLPVLGWGFSKAQNGFVLETTRSATNDLQSGNWLRLDFDSSVLPPGARALLLLVGNILGASEDTAQTLFSPGANTEAASVFAASAWWILDEATATGMYPSAPAPRTTGLGLELWVRDAHATVKTLPELQFVPNPVAESRYLGYLPTDVDLFRSSDRAELPPGETLREEVTSPRFPLASQGGRRGIDLPRYLPLGVPGFLREDFYQPALPQSLSSLERDGLAPQTSCSHFGAEFFLDPDLANSNVLTLMTEAFHKQYQFTGPDSTGVPLVKMHAILPVDEVSLLAVPDAIHRGWVSTLQTQTTLAAPILTNISEPDSGGQVTLNWDSVAGATGYTLQRSNDSQFATANDVWQGEPMGSPAQSGPIAEQFTCPQTVYFRVRAQGSSGAGPWSNTLSREFPAQTFEVCNPDPLVAPALMQTADNRGRISLSWSITASNVDAFQLQVANEPAFDLPELIYAGTQTTFEVWKSPLQTSYFRVAAQRQGEGSPFSNTVTVAAETSVQQWQMVESEDDGSDSTGGACEDELLSIHQAMLRLCAARADLSGLLSLPRQYGADAALNYENRLKNLLHPEEVANILSYGALYHPWLVVRDASDDSAGAIRGLAPDGTVCGTCASRTLASGAWVSPANEVLAGVVDLEPALDDGAVASFFANQINVTRQESRGFLCLSSQTLSTDSRLVEFNVRRLLILLRRVALRDGMPYVFQQNDIALRYLVRRNFEDLLGRMYALGAFAGDTEDQAFRVVTDSSVNTPASADQGQFIVELRVAPSLPLEFLTVRLVQTGGEITFTEGV